MKKTNDSENKR